MGIQPKWLSLLTASVLTLSISGQALAADSTFTDLRNVQGQQKIESLKERGFVSGVTATEFKPNQTLNAAQGIQMLVNSFQLSLAQFTFIKAPKASDSYTKVKDGVWYSDAFIIAAVNGVEVPRSVDPAADLTREQFTSYLMQSMEKAGNLPMINIKPVKIGDSAQLTPSYQGAVQRSLVMNINELDAKGNFDPKGKITRAEAAVMIYNALDYLQKHPEMSQPAAGADHAAQEDTDDTASGESTSQS
ncbi:S-layer homology domain-containing protein [Paenibacillus bovis]|uniref:Amylopullulanase n=1 Tax=Paenibacillus bovis TaxID=1616788 RepID=A0A172ZK32_9BACL|nr:S-layer homology domain-containing protein [Paenibacillus bovis]ANF97958.1 amylopullulanase [Paenibacillus bovis]